MRVFEELTPECDKTAQLFAVGLYRWFSIELCTSLTTQGT